VLIDVRLPELAESLVEGEVVRWLVAVGSPLVADQPLLEVMTDKVSVELPTPVVGVLREIVAAEGAVVAVGGLLARVEVATPTAAGDPGGDPSLFKPPRNAVGAPPLPTVVKRRGAAVARGGTAMERGAWPPPPPVVTPAGYAAREQRSPLRGVRKRIKEQLVASHLYTVRTLHVDEVDVSALQALRAAWLPAAAAQGVKLSPLPFILKGLAALLPAYPALRSALDEEAGEVVVRDYLNFGVAVDTEQGLIVPVVRDVDAKPLLRVASEVQSLAAAARDGTLPPEALQAGSFTVTNIGAIGGLFSFPIIHAPEAAILGVHSIRERAVVLDDGTIAARPMLYLSLAFDHRLVDGGDAARFTRDLIALLANPDDLPLE